MDRTSNINSQALFSPRPEEIPIPANSESKKPKLSLILLGVLVIMLIASVSFFVDKSLNKPKDDLLPTPTPLPSETPVAEIDETADWKTYINKKYNFEFKYPPISEPEEYQSKEIYYIPIVSIELSMSGKLTSPEQVLPEKISLNAIENVDIYEKMLINLIAQREVGDSGFKYTISKTSINNYEAARVDITTNNNNLQYFIKSPNKNLIIVVSSSSKSKELISQILSTFKFLETASPTETTKPSLSIKYSPKPDWQTYADKVAKFSFQYNTTPTGPYNLRESLGANEPGKTVMIMGCNTPTSGPNIGKEVCLRSYELTIYSNYTGGSRREWLEQQHFYDSDCQKYYVDLSVANKNALIVTSSCSSWGETWILIPNGSQMIVYSSQDYIRNNSTGKITLPDSTKETLSTFRFDGSASLH